MAIGLPAPVHLMRAALSVVPPPALPPLLAAAMATMRRQHAPLLRRLTRLAPATIRFEPADVPHRFILAIARHGVALRLAGSDSAKPTVTMKGSLATLIGLLEGRTDSDTVFFARDLAVSGDTAVAVAFRNTLDGEAINLLEDAIALFGPLSWPAERLVEALDARVRRAWTRWTRLRDAVHRAAHGGHDVADERRRLLAEIEAIKARLAKLEARGRRAKEAAA